MEESHSNEVITTDVLGMNVSQLYELAIFSLDEPVRCAALGIGPEQLRTLYRAIGMDSTEDSSIRSFNILMLYLYLMGKTHYYLDNQGKVPWRIKGAHALEESLVHASDMAERFMAVLEAPRCLSWCMSYMFEAFTGTADTDTKRNMLMVLWGMVQQILVREDYEKIAQYFDPSALKSKKTRIKISRGMFYNILDVHRLLLNHVYGDQLNDMKLVITGSETRRKKLAKISPLQFLNIASNSKVGRAVYSAITRRC